MTAAELAAERAVLHAFDLKRRAAGHDYGCGQRWRELVRRQRELESRCVTSSRSAYELERDASPAELLAAFERVARPRIRRIEAEDYRRSTPSTQRTLRTWRRIGAELEALELKHRDREEIGA